MIDGGDVAQKNNELLRDPLKFWNIDVVDDALNGYFQLRYGFGIIAVYLVFNIVPPEGVKFCSGAENMVANQGPCQWPMGTSEAEIGL